MYPTATSAIPAMPLMAMAMAMEMEMEMEIRYLAALPMKLPQPMISVFLKISEVIVLFYPNSGSGYLFVSPFVSLFVFPFVFPFVFRLPVPLSRHTIFARIPCVM